MQISYPIYFLRSCIKGSIYYIPYTCFSLAVRFILWDRLLENGRLLLSLFKNLKNTVYTF